MSHRLLALAFASLAPCAHAALCTPDLVPAATLLVPYLEYCQGCASDTRVVVANSGAAPRLARVTLWSNAAAPVLTFDLYLQGYAQQEFGLRDLLLNGTLPVSGSGVSEPGRQAQPEQAFVGCNAGSDPADGSPVYGVGALDAAERASLRAALDGSADPVDGLCRALPRTDGRVTAYATVDVVDRCDAPRAGEAGFAAALEPDNVLLGHAWIVDGASNFRYAMQAIAIEAASAAQLAGGHTFYRFDGAGADDREPLPTSYAFYGSDGGITELDASVLIWRGVETVQSPFACTSTPPWYPLDYHRHGFGSSGGIVVDETGVPRRLRVARLAALATQPPFRPLVEREHVPAAPGAFYFNLQHRTTPPGEPAGQAWVGGITAQAGIGHSLQPASALDSGCRGPAFDNPSPGLAPPLPTTP